MITAEEPYLLLFQVIPQVFRNTCMSEAEITIILVKSTKKYSHTSQTPRTLRPNSKSQKTYLSLPPTLTDNTELGSTDRCCPGPPRQRPRQAAAAAWSRGLASPRGEAASNLSGEPSWVREVPSGKKV